MSARMSMVTVSATKKPGAAKGGAGKSAKKRLRKMEVEPTENGGAVVTHHFHPPDGTEYGMNTPASETHAFMKPKDAGKHVATMLEGMPGPGANAQMTGDTNGAPAASEN